MFEDAKAKYLAGLGASSLPSGVDSLNNYISIMQEAEGLARRHATEYIATIGGGGEDCCGGAETELEKIVETFKLLIVPDNTLQGLMMALGKDAARKEFRRSAMLVHPDKNSHPSAKIAFQKLYNQLKIVLTDSS